MTGISSSILPPNEDTLLTGGLPPPVPFRERGLVRFSTTLLMTLFSYVCSFFSGVVIARSLGASNFGDLNFLMGSVVAFAPLLEMGTSSAFYTFLAQRRRSWTFFAVYFGWMTLQFLLPLLVIGIALPASMVSEIWIGQPRQMILLGYTACFFVHQIWLMINHMGEARKKTIFVQTCSALQSIAHLGLISVVVHFHLLSVKTVLFLLLGEYLVLSAICLPQLIKENLAIKGQQNFAGVIREFAGFCKPLVLNAWLGFLYVFADRWLLQHYAGSVQQGLFSLSQQFAFGTLLITTAVQNILWKELAEAHELQDSTRIKNLYVLVTRSIYCFTAWTNCLLAIYSTQILSWTVGDGYHSASLCLALMFMYPLHQILGQAHGSLFFSQGDTRTHVKISILTMGLSMPLTYFVLAPMTARLPGLGLGAVGLALKMVVLQVFCNNLQGFVVARQRRWKFVFAYQIILVMLFLVIASFFKWFTMHAFVWTGPTVQPIASALTTGLLYSVVTLTLLWRVPSIAGLTSDDLQRIRKDVLQMFKGRGRPKET